MRSVEARFRNVKDKRNTMSTFAKFVRAIKGQGFNKQTIDSNFKELVDWDDYKGVNRQELFNWLYKI